MKSITAKVLVTIEVTCTDSWGAHCSLDQIERQAKESAIGMLSRQLHQDARRVRIVDAPKVSMIITERS